jgi:Domain of unknown function (DUF5664)
MPTDHGIKLDQGKPRADVFLGDFARALWAVCELAEYGAQKYSLGGWIGVPNAYQRYRDAKVRHWLKEKIEGPQDSESEYLHLVHEAWNSLAILELYLREHGGNVAERNEVQESVSIPIETMRHIYGLSRASGPISRWYTGFKLWLKLRKRLGRT